MSSNKDLSSQACFWLFKVDIIIYATIVGCIFDNTGAPLADTLIVKTKNKDWCHEDLFSQYHNILKLCLQIHFWSQLFSWVDLYSYEELLQVVK